MLLAPKSMEKSGLKLPVRAVRDLNISLIIGIRTRWEENKKVNWIIWSEGYSFPSCTKYNLHLIRGCWILSAPNKTYENTITSNSAKGMLFVYESSGSSMYNSTREIKACWLPLKSENKKLLGLWWRILQISQTTTY